MKSFFFWQKWLLSVGVLLVTMGIILTFFSQSRFMALIINDQIDQAFWAAERVPENAVLFQSWITGVLGATVSGWGSMIVFLALFPFKNRESWAWKCLAISMMIWYIGDTAISAYYHVTSNVMLNTILLLIVGLPLTFTRNHFFQQPE